MPKYECDVVNKYSKYISDTEDKLCYRTLEKIKNILLSSGFSISNSHYTDNDGLKYSFNMRDSQGNDFLLLLQGSFANATCIRQESDLDIAIISEKTFRGIYRAGVGPSNYGFVDSNFNIMDFKNLLISVLKNNGFNAKSGNKCINVDFDSNNKKSFDLVPCLRYRDYRKDFKTDPNNYQHGILIRTNDGNERINYPEQSIVNSTSKNVLTNYYYKKVVRILKNIKSDMEDNGYKLAKMVSSFELECLIYNVPNNLFQKNPLLDQSCQLKYISQQVLAYLNKNRGLFNWFVETNDILSIYADNSKNLSNTIVLIQQMFDFYK